MQYSINGNTFTYPTSPTTVYTGTAIVKFTFEKDGNCTVYYNLGGLVYSLEGQWNFTDGIGKQKSKTQIVIHVTKEVSGGTTYTWTGNDNPVTYNISELRNNKMKISYSDARTGSNNSYDTYSEDWELIK